MKLKNLLARALSSIEIIIGISNDVAELLRDTVIFRPSQGRRETRFRNSSKNIPLPDNDHNRI